MRDRRTSLTLLAAALGIVVAGCGGRRGPAGAGEPGTTTILIENHVSSPDELDRVMVTIDDAVVPLTSIPPRDEEPTALTALRLPPGPHTISVRASAHGEGDARVVVAAAQIFHVATAAAAIGIDVRSRPGSSADERIAVDLRMKGGHMAAEFGAAPPEDKDVRCAPLLPMQRALCRAAGDMDEAARRNDLVAVLCVRDRLVEMRQLVQIGETSRGEAAGMAEKKIASLSREIDRCSRNDLAGTRDGTTVTKLNERPAALR